MTPNSPVSGSAPRTEVIPSGSGSRESYWVLQGIVAIVLLSAVIIGIGRRDSEATASLGPHQVLFRDQSSEVQRMDRELLSGLEDAIRLRSPQEGWPTVDALARELVPPFVSIPGAVSDYSWELLRKDSIVTYLGRPRTGSGRPAFLLHLQENIPHPGITALDEFHRKLEDGTLLHVGVWFHTDSKLDPGVVAFPEREGWTEVVLGSPLSAEK